MALKSSMKILLVDEDGSMKQIVRKMLTNMGFKNIVDTTDGNKAWNMLVESAGTEKPIQFVICEWNVPNLPGIELLKKVRTNEKLAKLPFLMITGEADQQNVVLAVKAGVSNVMVKPYSANTLMEKIQKIFKQ